MEVKKLLDFYHKEISADEFMNYLNVSSELKELFNKTLKNAPASDSGQNAVEWINSCHRIRPGEGKDAKDKRDYMVWLYVKEFLSKGKNIQYLSKEDVISEIIATITDMPAFYSANFQVEEFIKNNIISAMPKTDSLNKSIKHVKEELKNHFKYDSKMPSWIQNCEWPFNEQGKPLVFKEEKGNMRNKQFIFYDPKAKQEMVIEQFD